MHTPRPDRPLRFLQGRQPLGAVQEHRGKLKVKNKSKFKIIEFENSQDDFSKVAIKTVQVTEYDTDIEDKK